MKISLSEMDELPDITYEGAAFIGAIAIETAPSSEGTPFQLNMAVQLASSGAIFSRVTLLVALFQWASDDPEFWALFQKSLAPGQFALLKNIAETRVEVDPQPKNDEREGEG